MPESLINRRTAITFCCGLIISLSIFFLLKHWEENNRSNEFNYKAQDHAAAIQTEFEHVLQKIAEVRYIIEHQININHDDPSQPDSFMPMAEHLIIDDSSLLSIVWTLRQKKDSEHQRLTILYIKSGSHNSGNLDDLQLHEAYDQHILNFNMFDQKSLINSFIHKDTDQYNELNFVAPVADRMQDGIPFKGKHIGSLIVEMNISGLIERAITKLPVSAQDISLHILHPDSSKQTVYKHMSRSRSPKEKNIHTSLRTNVTFEFSGLQWQLEFEAAPKFLRTHPVVLAWQSLALGLFLTFFWVWYAHFTRKQTLLIEQKVIARTDALNKSKNKLRRIINSLQDTYFQTDAEGNITDCSPSVFNLIGYKEHEVVGTPMTNYYTSTALREQLLAALQHSNDGKLFSYENKALHRDGRHIWTSSNIQYIHDKQGNITGIEGTIRDISDKKQAEHEKEDMLRQIEHTQRLESLGILAGGIAHDFNNILAAIMGNASLADHKIFERPHDSKEHITKIIKASEKASILCQQMLAYAGKGRFIIESVNISVLLDEVTELLNVSIAPNVSLHYQLKDQLPHIDGDKAQLQQLFMNFTTNANEAIQDHGEINISTGQRYLSDKDLKTYSLGCDNPKAGEYIYVAFRDTGCGMDADTISKVFDPFFTTKFTGRGLGMSAVLGIIKGHNGLIQCDSTPGKGTTFTVLLPVSDNQLPDLLPDSISAKPQQQLSGSILIIDDEEFIRELAQAMLEDLGCASISAANGAAGIALFEQQQDSIAAVILDMTMPGMDGLSIFDAIKAIDPNIKVILSTGYSEHEASNRFKNRGLFGFLQKPYTLEQLQQQISAITNTPTNNDLL